MTADSTIKSDSVKCFLKHYWLGLRPNGTTPRLPSLTDY